MKHLTFLLVAALALNNINCTAQKDNSTTGVNSKSKKNMIQKVVLEEVTRGNRFSWELTPSAKISERNNVKTAQIMTETEWNRISTAAGNLDLSKINSYESPTTERFHDGAYAASITISSGGKIYNSQSFDAGKPPKELAALYKEIKPGAKIK